jgi:hypothetical protein
VFNARHDYQFSADTPCFLFCVEWACMVSHVRSDGVMIVDLGVFLLVLHDRLACISFAHAVSRLDVHMRGTERDSWTRAVNY